MLERNNPGFSRSHRDDRHIMISHKRVPFAAQLGTILILYDGPIFMQQRAQGKRRISYTLHLVNLKPDNTKVKILHSQ